ncbi:basic blue protein-like [Mangifera indica]|uniref:basic blue protein-like n=1 Tax=Mangifera indica TaxID=29780 RepID=UPI001CFA56FD|nr:basic blue protein-like [Mangifera indica]
MTGFLQGRCGAKSLPVATALILIFLLQFRTTKATTFTVGDTSGWTFTFNQNWTNGKKFKAGDILVFNYDPSLHNVAVVDVNDYSSCSSSPSSKTYSTGKDKIKLSKGRNYFICSIPGHCDGGLKVAVDAS